MLLPAAVQALKLSIIESARKGELREKITEEKLKVEVETMIANIGGYLGMILGTTCPFV